MSDGRSEIPLPSPGGQSSYQQNGIPLPGMPIPMPSSMLQHFGVPMPQPDAGKQDIAVGIPPPPGSPGSAQRNSPYQPYMHHAMHGAMHGATVNGVPGMHGGMQHDMPSMPGLAFCATVPDAAAASRR